MILKKRVKLGDTYYLINMLPKSIKNGKEFLDLFYSPEIDELELTKKTKLSLFILRIDGGRFAYEEMKTQLGNAALAYVFSRTQVNGMKPGHEHELIKKVQDSFRKWEENEGEGGELFLYCFLETHLGAPKILSKMELKTAGNDYIKGSDGIHLLSLDNGVFHLIFGESKMISDANEKGSSLRKALRAAFQSVKQIEKNSLGKEINLVDSNLMKETFDQTTLDYLKKIIKPSAKDDSPKKYNAFGIFVGFEIDIVDWDLQEMSDEDFITKIKSEIKLAVESKYKYITDQIAKENLAGYHFYIYAVPFIKDKEINIDSIRKDLIKHIQ